MSIPAVPPPLNDPINENGEQAGSTFRSLPHNVEAEKSLLGAIFANNRAHEKVSEFLFPEHFVIAQHGKIYDACSRLIEKGQIANPVSLKRLFEQDEGLIDIGGTAYLVELAESMVSIINAGEYGRIIYDLHLKRSLIGLGEDVVNRAYGGDVEDEATRQIEAAEQTLYDLATTGNYEGGFQPFKTSVITALRMAEGAHKRDGALAGVTSGLVDIDTMLGGLHPSDLLVLAGRPSMGKTALATNIAFNAAYTHQQTNGEQGAVVGFFSLEMSAEQLATRIISEQTQISSDSIRKGKITTPEFDRLVAGSQALHDIPIFIDDTPALTVSALRTRARRLKRQHKLGLIVVDYLQLISGSGSSRNDGRVQEVSEITRGLKTLAKELDLPVIALSQLSRAVEQREDKRPMLSDLRESGSIEQDADVVMFIFREEYYLERKGASQHENESDDKFFLRQQRNEERLEKVRNIAELIVAKQRHGPVGTVELQFTGKFTRFSDLERIHQPDYQ